MTYDLKELFEFALFSWLKEKTALKYFAVFFVFLFVTNLAASYFFYYVFEPLAKNPTASLSQVAGMGAYLVLFIVIFVILVGILSAYIFYFVIQLALKVSGRKSVEFTFARGIKLVLLGIACSIASFFSIFKPKMLLIPLAGAVSIIVGIFLLFISTTMSGAYYGGAYLFAIAVVLLGVCFILLGLVIFLAYLFVAFYNSIRLSMAQLIFVEKEKGVMESLKESWDITRGNVFVLGVVIVIFVVSVVLLSMFVSIPLQTYVGAIDSTTQSSQAINSIKALVDPIAILLSVPSMFIQVIATFVEIFLLVGLYTHLPFKSKTLPKLATTPRRHKVSIRAKKR